MLACWLTLNWVNTSSTSRVETVFSSRKNGERVVESALLCAPHFFLSLFLFTHENVLKLFFYSVLCSEWSCSKYSPPIARYFFLHRKGFFGKFTAHRMPRYLREYAVQMCNVLVGCRYKVAIDECTVLISKNLKRKHVQSCCLVNHRVMMRPRQRTISVK